MARALGISWISSSHGLVVSGSSSRAFSGPPATSARWFRAKSVFRLLQGLRLSKVPEEEMPIVAGREGAASPSGWSEQEMEMVRKDLEGSREVVPEQWCAEVLAEDVTLLTKFRSRYNMVQVLEIRRSADSVLAGSRVLLLDDPGNIHSLHYMFKPLTNAYYDVFASLPPLIPRGPVGILGLGAGTAARILHHFWPSLEMHGWEIDPSVVAIGRRYFDMRDLESGKPSQIPRDQEDDVDEDYLKRSGLLLENEHKGRLVVHIGDALNAAAVEGGFAGLIVDLYSKGKLLPALQDPTTWENLKQQLMPGGRIMTNCGGTSVVAQDGKDGSVTMQETLQAMRVAFPDQVSTRTLYPEDSCLAMTGPFPDLEDWKQKLPNCLRDGVSEWKPDDWVLH